MNKKNFFRIVVMASVVSAIIVSCAKDDTSDPVTLPRDKFIGTWHVSAHGTNSGNLTWDVIIEAASASLPEGIVMKNFDQIGNDKSVPADVSGNNLAIPGTVVGAVTIEGTGSLSNNILTFDYTSTDSQTDTVHATATK